MFLNPQFCAFELLQVLHTSPQGGERINKGHRDCDVFATDQSDVDGGAYRTDVRNKIIIKKKSQRNFPRKNTKQTATIFFFI
ncbi:hypothetical protein GDO86_017539 [Hymenochirus boettgeri]|uniref:Uncharacterized protein n=1 Tax=Hymenochirus boettgeri TaxID=247094 RepID=A0A8T2IQD1_9PIPI|nr:hypothetical protein GDO86_017539 [Hymenochirus boettgeri]